MRAVISAFQDCYKHYMKPWTWRSLLEKCEPFWWQMRLFNIQFGILPTKRLFPIMTDNLEN